MVIAYKMLVDSNCYTYNIGRSLLLLLYQHVPDTLVVPATQYLIGRHSAHPASLQRRSILLSHSEESVVAGECLRAEIGAGLTGDAFGSDADVGVDSGTLIKTPMGAVGKEHTKCSAMKAW